MKEIELHGKYGQGKFALVDDEDFEWLNKFHWYCGHSGYATRKITVGKGEGRQRKGRQRTIFMHRIILNTKENEEGDHINHNTLDNQRKNLRACTRMENCWNSSKQKGSSRHKGVYWVKKDSVWMARIAYKKKRLYLGCFLSEDQAGMVYNEKAIELYGKFAVLNKI